MSDYLLNRRLSYYTSYPGFYSKRRVVICICPFTHPVSSIPSIFVEDGFWVDWLWFLDWGRSEDGVFCIAFAFAITTTTYYPYTCKELDYSFRNLCLKGIWETEKVVGYEYSPFFLFLLMKYSKVFEQSNNPWEYLNPLRFIKKKKKKKCIP